MSQLSRNIVSMYVPRVVAVGVSLFLFPFIAHHVGLSHYGIWLLISSVTVFFLADFGIGISAIRYIAAAVTSGDEEEVRRVVSTTFAFFAVLGAVASVGFVVFMIFFIPSTNIPAEDRDTAIQMLVTVAVGLFLLGLPLQVFKFVLAGAQRYDIANLILLFRVLVRGAVIVALLLGGAGIFAVALTEAIVTVAAGIVAAVLARREVPELLIARRYVSLGLLKSMLPYSLQVFVIGISALVILHTDNLIIGVFLPVAAVTLYAGAYRAYQACRDITGSIMHPLIPDASRAQALGNRKRIQRLLLQGTKYSNAVMLLLAVPVLFYAEPLLLAWVGERFTEVALVTQLLVAGLIVSNNHVVATSVLTGIGRVGSFAKYHALWAGANVVLSIALVQRMGLKGVALGTVIPILCLEPFYVRTALRETGVSTRAFLEAAVGRTLGPAVGASTLLWLLQAVWHPQQLGAFLSASIAYGFLFLALFFWLGLDAAEREKLLSLRRQLLSSIAPRRRMASSVEARLP